MSAYTQVHRARKSFMLAAWAGSCWHLGLLLCWQSIHSLKLNPNCFWQMFTVHIFFVIWFRSRTRVRYVMLMISEFLLGYFRTVSLGLIYNDVCPFWVLPGLGFMSPQSLYLSLFLLMYFSFYLKKFKKCLI